MKRENLSMQLKEKKYLYDIQKAIKFVKQFTSSKTFEDYQSDILLRSATERQLEIIGEATSQLSKLNPQLTSKISYYQHIISFRNILVHGYAEIDNLIVWGVIEHNLSRLDKEISKLMEFPHSQGNTIHKEES